MTKTLAVAAALLLAACGGSEESTPPSAHWEFKSYDAPVNHQIRARVRVTNPDGRFYLRVDGPGPEEAAWFYYSRAYYVPESSIVCDADCWVDVVIGCTPEAGGPAAPYSRTLELVFRDIASSATARDTTTINCVP